MLIDAFLHHAIEIDVDAICDGKGDVFVAGIMEHIEEAGVHSGDSACAMPPYSLERETIAEIERQTIALALALDVRGLMNMQFAVQGGEIFVLEVNPRASRTVPFVAKAIGLPVAAIAARVMAGETLAAFDLKQPAHKHIAVKEAVFPFARFPGVDTILGPEMRSTGEVMGLDENFGRAFAKSQIGAGLNSRSRQRVRLGEGCRQGLALAPARALIEMGFKIIATRGTAKSLSGRVPSQAHQQGAGGPPAHRGRDEERRNAARLQHHGGRAGAGRLRLHPPHHADHEGSLLHDHGGGRGRRPRPYRPARGLS